MLPKVNGKSFLELNENDLEELMDNPDFRENEYIDYKEDFTFLKVQKDRKDIVSAKTAEFRSDVCAFANAEGGYLVYGISEENGCAKEIVGIEIPDDNTDKFELARRTNLELIRPRIPYLKFHFIKLQNGKYVVIIFVKHDGFAPYIHIEGENNYRIFKRYGNGKKTMPYTELKNMFIQSMSLDKEIYSYRKERIEYYCSQKESDNSIYDSFVLLHIFPETFADPSYNQNMFILGKKKELYFSNIFGEIGCEMSHPCVDGLRFYSYESQSNNEGYLYNSGVAEFFIPLQGSGFLYNEENKQPYIKSICIKDKTSKLCTCYIEMFKNILNVENIYAGFSLIGCKGMISNKSVEQEETIAIDRNEVICAPVAVNPSDNENDISLSLKKLEIKILLSMGIKYKQVLPDLINEVYNA